MTCNLWNLNIAILLDVMTLFQFTRLAISLKESFIIRFLSIFKNLKKNEEICELSDDNVMKHQTHITSHFIKNNKETWAYCHNSECEKI